MLVDVLLDTAETLERGAAELRLRPQCEALRATATLAREAAAELTLGLCAGSGQR
jgi:hypothetical protein